jgi:hypothetical protein
MKRRSTELKDEEKAALYERKQNNQVLNSRINRAKPTHVSVTARKSSYAEKANKKGDKAIQRQFLQTGLFFFFFEGRLCTSARQSLYRVI